MKVHILFINIILNLYKHTAEVKVDRRQKSHLEPIRLNHTGKTYNETFIIFIYKV